MYNDLPDITEIRCDILATQHIFFVTQLKENSGKFYLIIWTQLNVFVNCMFNSFVIQVL